ncbi:DUF1963 domain-containing protein [Streptomyces sp. 2P-4]|uniref:DUF1963 domain-containing protein n=1 Tax=Streptomyces sp. 2P-4 TaxID=2931974 RepID=UPI002541C383|nr:DUF1963 domain-containing protein [Streptomyces sp. 2P-4]
MGEPPIAYMRDHGLREVPRRHLDDEDAARWAALLRPGLRLVPGETCRDAVPAAARLGGLPRLPAGAAWPTGPDGDPPAFVAEVDCAALPAGALDVPLPADGLLLFFASAPLEEDPSGRFRAGAAGPAPGLVVHVPAAASAAECPAPPGVPVFRPVNLAAVAELTAPLPDHPRVRHAFALHAHEDPYDHPVHGYGFLDELAEYAHRFEHRIGGYPVCGGHPEYEAAARSAGSTAPALPHTAGAQETERALEWVLLAQFACDPAEGLPAPAAAGGPPRTGHLVWLIRREDLAARRFAAAVLLRCF